MLDIPYIYTEISKTDEIITKSASYTIYIFLLLQISVSLIIFTETGQSPLLNKDFYPYTYKQMIKLKG